MDMSFLTQELQNAIRHLNLNYLSEIRLKRGQPVIIEYQGSYVYLGCFGSTLRREQALKVVEVESILQSAMGGNVFRFTEQIKNGFITVRGGIRIGLAGEYVTERNSVQTIRGITSLVIRIPHDVVGCSNVLFQTIFQNGPKSTLLFSLPGLGKTTTLRDMAKNFSAQNKYNVLVFDERNEIACFDEEGIGFDLGERVDVVRCYGKQNAIQNAIRVLKPQIVITDELYGKSDINAINSITERGIPVMASTHVTDREKLKKMPFEYFVQLTAIGQPPVVYDKNFNLVCDSRNHDAHRPLPFQ
jgi:stage III sporulation protein AA